MTLAGGKARRGQHESIPRQVLLRLFDAFDKLPADEIEPTCACFLAPDLIVSTDVARALLELRRARDELVRVDVKTQLDVPEVARVLTKGDRAAMRRFDGPLFVYLPLKQLRHAPEVLPQMAGTLATMLAIYEKVLFRQEDRLKLVYQAAVQDMRRRDTLELGALALRLLDEADRAVLGGFVGADGSYERVFVRLSTQLRVLLAFAAQFADGPAERPRPMSLQLLAMNPTTRPTLLRRLGVILQDGLETVPELRTGFMRYTFGVRAYRAFRPCDDHISVFVEWLRERHGRQESPTPYSMCAWGLLRELDRDRYDASDLTHFSDGLFPSREQAWLRMERLSYIGTHVKIPVF